MRILALALALLLAISPASAQFWGHYENARFGYGIDVPPDFVGNGESDSGDGQIFYNLSSEQSLTVWGGMLSESLEAEAQSSTENLVSAGWSISEQSSTPQWATLAAMRDHRLLYQRLIVLCDGLSFAAYRAEFNIRDLSAMDGVLGGLNRSFVALGC